MCKYVCIFMVYSFLGWVYETILLTVQNRKWENRGFLFGPICPIYGVGAVTIILLMALTQRHGIELRAWQVFAVSVVGSAILEYFTSWGLEKLFHAKWWDYSNWPLNLQGRISLLTSLGFGLAGLLIVYCLAPFTARLIGGIPPLLTELFALLTTSVLMIDLTLTVTVLRHFDQTVTHYDEIFNRSMDTLVDSAVQKTASIRQEVSTRQKLISMRFASMSGVARSAISRVKGFKYDGEKAREAVDMIVSFIKRHGKR